MEDLREDGCININYMYIPMQCIGHFSRHYKLVYKDKLYYFKYAKVAYTYNELVANELAKDFDINCVEYDLASYNGMIGNISEDYIKGRNHMLMSEFLFTNMGSRYSSYCNNIKTISSLFYLKFDDVTAEKLTNQLITLFIFDVLIANSDRNDNNYGLINVGGNVQLTPVFDNGQMLNEDVLYDGYYSLKWNVINDSDMSILEDFLINADTKWIDLLKSKLWIIDEKNLFDVFNRVENKIHCSMDDVIKNDMLKNFSINRKYIIDSLNKYDLSNIVLTL